MSPPSGPDTQETLAAQRSFLESLGLDSPLPPPSLQQRASGAFYPQFFLHGRDLLSHIAHILQRRSLRLDQFERILDFGCGCGRILIPAAARLPAHRIHGADIDAEAIDWCRTHLSGFGGFVLNPHHPPSPCPTGHFDFIYGVSVFTHLPEDLQFAWLDDLRRILAPGGFMVLSVHGEATWGGLSESERTTLLEEGFLHAGENQSTFQGLPAFYQTAYHTMDYLRQRWSEFFEVLEIVPTGIGGLHDGVLLQHR